MSFVLFDAPFATTLPRRSRRSAISPTPFAARVESKASAARVESKASAARGAAAKLAGKIPEARAAVHRASRRYSISRDGILAAPVAALQVFADLTPALRLRGMQRLPQSFRAGALGAEVATWGAVSPSLLPHNWWTTTANVAVLQGIGHGIATAAAQVLRPAGVGRRGPLPTPVRVAMSGVTVAVYGLSMHRGSKQEKLVEVCLLYTSDAADE